MMMHWWLLVLTLAMNQAALMKLGVLEVVGPLWLWIALL
jgi:hypothetical protein